MRNEVGKLKRDGVIVMSCLMTPITPQASRLPFVFQHHEIRSPDLIYIQSPKVL